LSSLCAAGELRAPDADRQRVIAALERHTAAGRPDLDEFTQRVDGLDHDDAGPTRARIQAIDQLPERSNGISAPTALWR